MQDIFADLNEQQKEAVAHVDGPCMVLAGAGSGKTRVLTRRIAHLVKQGIPPYQIMAITFTNKAAQEMRSRVISMLPDFNSQWIQTFHSTCNRILRMDITDLGYDKNFNIIDDMEAKSLIKIILREENDYETKPEELLYIFKQAKNSLEKPEEHFHNSTVPDFIKDRNCRVFKLYNSRLKSLNMLDFEDLIVLCIRLFQQSPSVLEKYQGWFRYIMIDEYQDTNYSQYYWARLLASRHRNIFVVGDPDQSIYSWRGAEPYNIKRFLRDYPDSGLIKLEMNYRSSENILNAANAIIGHNREREDKQLYSQKGQGEKLLHFCANDSFQEARFIADEINRLRRGGNRKFQECAIFYRTHAQSRVLEEALLYRDIPYRIVGARKFYERKEIKDILAYMRLVSNPNDLLSLERVINVPRRGIGGKTLEKIKNCSEEWGISLLDVLAEADSVPGIGKKMRAAMEDFHGMLKYFADLLASGASLMELLEQVIELTGYIEELEKSKAADAGLRIENLKELRSLVIEFEREGGKGLEEFLAQAALVQESDELDQSDHVLLMTLHGAKGLEFPVVFITGLEEGVFPSYRSQTAEEMEEERRLCYVGITRAQERLYLSHASSRLLYGYERSNPPSRFLYEIPEELLLSPQQKKPSRPVFEVGDRVLHAKFGVGLISELNKEEEIAVVEFVQAGTRMLRLDIAPLEKIE